MTHSVFARCLGALLVSMLGLQPTAVRAAAPGQPTLAPASSAPLSPDPSLEAFVDGAVEEAMASDKIAGVSVAVVRDGKVQLLRGYGFAKSEGRVPVDPRRTLFRVASITKTLTWIAVMREVEKGRLDLDEPVNTYLPDRLKIPDQGFVEPVRIKHLMSHSAGFADTELGHIIVDRPDRLVALGSYLAAHRPRRVREPGRLSSYSNYGAALAGYIVARLNQATYPALIEGEIFRPLGMTQSTMREHYPPKAGLPAPASSALARDFSEGFDWGGGTFSAQPVEYLSNAVPAGTARMSAADAARYMQLLLNEGTFEGVRLFGPQSARAFRTPLMRVPDGTNGWAHGFVALSLPGGVKGYGHSGATQYFQANLVIVPAMRMGIFIAANTSSAWGFARRFPGLVVSRLQPGRALVHRPGDPALVHKASDYSGGYQMTRRPSHGLESFVDRLGGLSHVTVTSDGYLVTSYGPLVQAWVPGPSPGTFLAASGDERLGFVLDQAGRAIRMPLPSGNAWLERSSLLYERSTFDRLGLAAFVAGILAWLSFVLRRRDRVDATGLQKNSGMLLLAASTAWIVAGVLFYFWLPTLDSSSLMYNFPDPLIRAASLFALIGAFLSSGLVLTVPFAWLSGGASGWSVARRLEHTALAIPLLAFSLLAGLWDALNPFA